MRGKTIVVMTVLVLMLLGLAVHNHSRSAPPVAPKTSDPSAGGAHSNSPRIALAAHRTKAQTDGVPADKNSLTKYLTGKEFVLPKLEPWQVEPFVEANRRSAGSLLAAFRTTSDPKFLAEAMEKFPNDPRVAYAAAFKPDTTPEERHAWLDRMKQSDPGNALGNYLSAYDDFKSGQSAQALQEMAAAAGKPGWQDYTTDFVQNSEEAYLAAGYSETEAKAVAAMSSLLPDLSQLKSVGRSLTDLAKSYQTAGDPASAQAALQATLNLGEQINGGAQQPIITSMVGIAIERLALDAMDPTAPYGNTGQTVQDRVNELVQQRKAINNFGRQEDALLGTMSDSEVANYYDRLKTFGPLPTLQWAVSKYGAQ